jgi:hypothetical protein
MCYPPIDQIAEGMELPDNVLERKGYRLPTEAEWEYASRAGSTARYCFGYEPSLLERYSRYQANSSAGTSPVGGMLPNAFGLFDMHGNVMEWCLDAYRPYEAALTTLAVDGSSPLSESTSEGRVLRGGGWTHGPSVVRSAFRNGLNPHSQFPDDGFRIARTLDLGDFAVVQSDCAQDSATYRVLGQGRPFTISDIAGPASVEPKSGVAPLDIKVSIPTDNKEGVCSFLVTEDSTGKQVRIKTVFPRWNWELAFYRWEPNPTYPLWPPVDLAQITSQLPVARQRTEAIDFDWGDAAPGADVPADYFLMIGQCRAFLPAGRYECWQEANDGMRVTIDGREVFRKQFHLGRSYATIEVAEGYHDFRLEYVDIITAASAHFGIRFLNRPIEE